MKNEFYSLASYYHRKFYVILPIFIFSIVLILFLMKSKNVNIEKFSLFCTNRTNEEH